MKVTCGFYIFLPNGKFLIGHPTNSPMSLWSIPKGIRDAGETELEAAKRELYEETSIVYTDLSIKKVIELPLVKYKSKGKYNKSLKSYILLLNNDISNKPLICDSMVLCDKPFPEIDIFKWVDCNEGFSLLHSSQVVNKSIILNKIKNEFVSLTKKPEL